MQPDLAESVGPNLWQRTVERVRNYGALAVAGAMAAVMLVNPVDSDPSPGREFNPFSRPVPLPEAGGDKCPKVIPEAIIYSDKLLSGPTNPRFEELRNQKEAEGVQQGMDDMQSYDYGFEQARRTLKHELASTYGLTVHDVPNKVIENDLFPPPDVDDREGRGNLPFGTYLEHANEFLANYGIEIVIGERGEDYGWNLTGPKAEQLETIQAKESIYYLLRFVSELPVEFVKLIGWERIRLTSTVDQPEEHSLTAAASAGGNTVNLNITGVGYVQILGHEIGHLGDGVFCGGRSERDPGFEALNKGMKYSKENPPQAALKAELASIEGAPNKTPEIKARILEIKKQLVFKGGSDSLVEDKANNATEIPLTNIGYELMLNGESQAIAEKFIYLFSRIAQHSPRIAAYLAGMSRHDVRESGQLPMVQQAQKDVAKKNGWPLKPFAAPTGPMPTRPAQQRTPQHARHRPRQLAGGRRR
jgi:hypothetical protein